MNGRLVDVSAQMFGKYQDCTKFDGRWYADCDFEDGHGIGPLKDGSVSDCGFVYRRGREAIDRASYKTTTVGSTNMAWKTWADARSIKTRRNLLARIWRNWICAGIRAERRSGIDQLKRSI